MWKEKFNKQFENVRLHLVTNLGVMNYSNGIEEIKAFIKANFVEKQHLKEALEEMKESLEYIENLEKRGMFQSADVYRDRNKIIDDILKLIE